VVTGASVMVSLIITIAATIIGGIKF